MGTRLAESADIAEGTVQRIADTPAGPLALLRLNGVVHAASDLCPHARAWMSEGFLEGDWLVCPTHFAEFDVHTGAVRNAPPGCRPLPIHAVSECDGVIYLDAA